MYELVTENITRNPFDFETESEQYYEFEYAVLDWVRISIIAWPKLLNLAITFGWQQMGTIFTPKYPGRSDRPNGPDVWDDWDGSYLCSEGQYITKEDAAGLADALEIAINQIPDNDTTEKLVTYDPGDFVEDNGLGGKIINYHLRQGHSVQCENVDLTPTEFFNGSRKKVISDFILFCRKGGFCIV